MAYLPDLCSRLGSAAFTAINDSETLTLGSRIYTFLDTLGATPPAGNVHIEIQSGLADTVKLLAKAIRGEADISILYAAGESNNPECTAYWTSQRFALDDVQVVAGQNVYIVEREEDSNTPITLSTTCSGCSLNSLRRAGFSRYFLDGNNATDAQQSIRGSYQMILPINFVGFAYTINCINKIYCSMSSTSCIEIDLYRSPDEVTFTRVVRSTSFPGASYGALICEDVDCDSISANEGLYYRLGTDGTDPTNYIDIKFSYVAV
ncbi:hypothetical protein UNSWDHB_600 [Dehalobacter sp. UNSWDHB]|jgi:hypothetical protein|uniref:hypothetical protein n=1 Tax=unclassified Dehalobacter TaxID=2635733 RepID=UPI00028B3E64|nr:MULTISPECIES: hypothetical protein [unclassified Dehalobacter]AFV02957.1 hypothetical protein DHBDCA_p1931 [Dehalobacter sp. DCA]AFV05944.1 hypothetical protein DCF50_p1942 [Dehalobacter sp. CF]EQB22063.1 hypothetical protein UNSWDHB_600 [Dehalobacter sp. UNSWDHB]